MRVEDGIFKFCPNVDFLVKVVAKVVLTLIRKNNRIRNHTFARFKIQVQEFHRALRYPEISGEVLDLQLGLMVKDVQPFDVELNGIADNLKSCNVPLVDIQIKMMVIKSVFDRILFPGVVVK